MQLLLLLLAGLAGGFIAGLIGVGGGVIFAPVLFFYFQAIGVDPSVLAPLTIGSSLFCTLLAAVASAWFQVRKQSIIPRVALSVGVFSIVAVFLVTRFVTTQPWYDEEAFQVVFSVVLLTVVVRMVFSKRTRTAPDQPVAASDSRWPALATTGTVAGAVSAAAGVGGGVVLVPAYSNFLKIPIHLAVGTSSATIVLIALSGVVTNMIAGWGAPVPATAVGYVDVGRALLLAAPAVLTARLGVWTAHRINTTALRWSFAVIAAFVATRLLWNALGGA